MGIKTVAVHSVADANSLFVKVSRYIDKYRAKVYHNSNITYSMNVNQSQQKVC